MDGFWVILEGKGGELSREFSENEADARLLAIKILQAMDELYDGDVIRIEEGWSER